MAHVVLQSVGKTDPASEPTVSPRDQRYGGRLFMMMALQFFIWGAWTPLIFGYLPKLGFTALQQSLVLATMPASSILGMFFITQWADRHFAAEKCLAISNLIGGVAILGCAFTTQFTSFFLLMLVHCLLAMPMISIANAIAFAHMKEPAKEFGIVRMGGTVGYIIASWPCIFIFVNWDAVPALGTVGFVEWIGAVFANPLTGDAVEAATKWTFVVAGLASFALAAFTLKLPPTPPKKVGEGAGEKLAWLEAMRLLKHPFVLVLWLVTLVDAFVHNSYYNWTAIFLGTSQQAGGVGIASNWISPAMSTGQVMEIFTMIALGATLKALGWKTTMIIGILGHAGRFAVYAFFPQHPTLIILVQVLHGICYAFFFAAAYIFVDACFPKDIRSSAQGLFNFQIFGVGPLIANAICPYLIQHVYTANDTTDFRGLFLVPMFTALGATILLGLFFHPPKELKTIAAGAAAPSH